VGLGAPAQLTATDRTFVKGAEVRTLTDRVLSDIAWSSDLDELKQRANREQKLIFWLQIVGELGGGL
jgi:hypothetical protein